MPQSSVAADALTRDLVAAATVREGARLAIDQHETAVHGSAAAASDIDG
jgi:hypothetical protein